MRGLSYGPLLSVWLAAGACSGILAVESGAEVASLGLRSRAQGTQSSSVDCQARSEVGLGIKGAAVDPPRKFLGLL